MDHLVFSSEELLEMKLGVLTERWDSLEYDGPIRRKYRTMFTKTERHYIADFKKRIDNWEGTAGYPKTFKFKSVQQPALLNRIVKFFNTY